MPAGSSCQLCLPGTLVSEAFRWTLPGALVSLVLIFKTSRDTKKLGFLTLGFLNVSIMNFGCFETGCFGFGGVFGAGQIEFFEFRYWAF
jgi:hypothetical protein